MKFIVNQNFIINNEEEEEKQFLKPQAEFLSSKQGTFSKLERTCKIVDKGVMEYEDDKKDPKLKEIKDFLNKIEHFSGGNKN